MDRNIEEDLSLEYHDELNPKLWDGDVLKRDVREHLRTYARAWLKHSEIIQPADVIDVIMTGGNANYNYTSKSDIDVHLVVDKSKLPIEQPYLDMFLQDKKKLWQLTHDDTVYGYPLEPYAQDGKDTPNENQGVYSLLHNHWLSKPSHSQTYAVNAKSIENKADYYERFAIWLIKTKASIGAMEALKAKIQGFRAAGLKSEGEYAAENLLFKELRNRGVFDKINSYIIQKIDDIISIN